MPCLVDEVGVGAHGVDLHAEFLELFIFFSHILKFGWAYECEVGRIEEKDCPFAEHILVCDCLELAVVVCLYLEFRDAGVDYRFHIIYFCVF